ncbi:DUF2624 domain-containing protein [Bacillus sp. FSL K6-3431]|uniref:DUF2624 domain-containing protein n=1 Tax=Bacillus sp. FSL K6-3431 TaxID=2921500 RepID=UPI0030FA137A
MNLLKNMVNSKMNNITADELLKYAGEINMELARPQAEQIAKYLHGKHFDIFDDKTRAQIIKEIAKVSGPKTAKELNKLFIQHTAGL